MSILSLTRLLCPLLWRQMLLSSLLMVLLLVHCPFGIASLVLLCLVLAALYFVVGGALAVGLVVSSDACPNMEQIAISVTAGTTYTPLVRWGPRTRLWSGRCVRGGERQGRTGLLGLKITPKLHLNHPQITPQTTPPAHSKYAPRRHHAHLSPP